MNATLFLTLIMAFASISVLLTEAIKKFIENKNEKNASANLISLINAVVLGGGGTAAYYILNGIAFTVSNIIYLIFLVIAVWIGSMIGYDKIIQLVKQITNKGDE